MVRWADIATMAGGRLMSGDPHGPLPLESRVVIDSRDVHAGDLFVALVGPRHDAHDFLADVAHAGAAGVMVSDADAASQLPAPVTVIVVDDTQIGLARLARAHRDHFNIPVAAITGSCGKTTTKEMVRTVLAHQAATDPVLITAGNRNNHIGMPLTLLGLRDHHRAAVVEVGINQRGEMDRLCAICRPTLGLITNIGAAHLEGLGDVAGVATEKARLFAHLGASGTAVVNLDDLRVAAAADGHPDAHRVTYSTDPARDATVTLTGAAMDGPSHVLRVGTDTHPVAMADAPAYQVANAAAAAALCHALQVPIAVIATGLSAFTPPAMRGTEHRLANGATLVDDSYNANPESMAAALAALATATVTGRRIAVLGTMLELGANAARWHRDMGAAAIQTGVARLICVGDHRRAMAQGAKNAIAANDPVAPSGTQVVTCQHPAGALRHLSDLGAGDRVVIKGSRGCALDTLVARLRGNEASNGSANGEATA